MPGLDTVAAYVVVIFILLVIIVYMIKNVKKGSALLVNVILGGTLFIGLNIANVQIPVNFFTIVMTAILGVPGVIILLIMKYVLGVL